MAMRITPISSRSRSASGFTLLELALVVTIIGIISAIALPSYQRIQRNTRFGALINDYRVFAGAFQQYSAVNAAWPAYGGPTGEFPQGMEAYLRTTNWSQPSVIGGHYNWDRDVFHNGRKVKAAIAIYPTDGNPLTMTEAEMQLFDDRYDDGNLTTGTFQRGFGNNPLYIIEDDSVVTLDSSAPPVPNATPSDLEGLPDVGEEPEIAAAPPNPENPDDDVSDDKGKGKGKGKSEEKGKGKGKEGQK
jgi:prepilin-type N-terminal cleavage/methylation domain-containing protein